MDLRWEKTRGGSRPEYILRQYNNPNLPFHNPIVGSLVMLRPKRRKWCVSVIGMGITRILCNLDRLPDDEAMNVAKLLIHGYINA